MTPTWRRSVNELLGLGSLGFRVHMWRWIETFDLFKVPRLGLRLPKTFAMVTCRLLCLGFRIPPRSAIYGLLCLLWCVWGAAVYTAQLDMESHIGLADGLMLL